MMRSPVFPVEQKYLIISYTYVIIQVSIDFHVGWLIFGDDEILSIRIQRKLMVSDFDEAEGRTWNLSLSTRMRDQTSNQRVFRYRNHQKNLLISY